MTDLVSRLRKEGERCDAEACFTAADEITRLRAELAACAAALPGVYYMDPPDGGDVSVSEQLRRMAKDAERYRIKHLQEQEGQHPLEGLHINQGSLDAAADAYEAEYNEAQEARRAERDAEMRADAFGPKHG